MCSVYLRNSCLLACRLCNRAHKNRRCNDSYATVFFYVGSLTSHEQMVMLRICGKTKKPNLLRQLLISDFRIRQRDVCGLGASKYSAINCNIIFPNKGFFWKKKMLKYLVHALCEGISLTHVLRLINNRTIFGISIYFISYYEIGKTTKTPRVNKNRNRHTYMQE